MHCISVHSTRQADEREVEEGASWHLGRRLLGMQGHIVSWYLPRTSLSSLSLSWFAMRWRYNMAIMPMRHSWKGIDRSVFKEKLGSASRAFFRHDHDRWSCFIGSRADLLAIISSVRCAQGNRMESWRKDAFSQQVHIHTCRCDVGLNAGSDCV